MVINILLSIVEFYFVHFLLSRMPADQQVIESALINDPVGYSFFFLGLIIFIIALVLLVRKSTGAFYQLFSFFGPFIGVIGLAIIITVK